MIRLRVREIAEAKGVTMTQLSRVADIDYITVQRIFRDPSRKISLTTLDKIAKALGVPATELIEDVADKGE